MKRNIWHTEMTFHFMKNEYETLETMYFGLKPLIPKYLLEGLLMFLRKVIIKASVAK